jgi:hypothetical protein
MVGVTIKIPVQPPQYCDEVVKLTVADAADILPTVSTANILI